MELVEEAEEEVEGEVFEEVEQWKVWESESTLRSCGDLILLASFLLDVAGPILVPSPSIPKEAASPPLHDKSILLFPANSLLLDDTS